MIDMCVGRAPGASVTLAAHRMYAPEERAGCGLGRDPAAALHHGARGAVVWGVIGDSDAVALDLRLQRNEQFKGKKMDEKRRG